jgi:hypothetical protein
VLIKNNLFAQRKVQHICPKDFMRVIKELVFPDCKASIFYMNQKYIIKFERGNLEQTYKLSELDYIIADVSDIETLIQDKLHPRSVLIFEQMNVAMQESISDII